jgi:hypothetical protein
MGCLLPVRPWHPLSARSFRYSLHRPCSRKRLRERSSPGVRPSYTVCPKVPARGLSVYGHLSWGSNAPTALWEKGVHGSPVARSSAPVLPGLCWRVPPRRLRCRSQVFSTSQRPCSSLRRPAIFRQVALLGLRPPGVCSCHAAPTTRRRRHALLTFLPLAGLPPS